ncbi:MAG: sugar phosphate nucleotidyltransferase [Chloroflexota bacterium]
MKAVILVGGEGTRLRPLTLNRPKPMVPILNQPFLEHVIEYLKGHDIHDIILALCYLPDRIRAWFGDGTEFGVNLTYVVEQSPLGTAGAVKNVAHCLEDDVFFVFNGDIYTDLDLTEMLKQHRQRNARLSIALTPVDDPSIYGVVETEPDGRVRRFLEKPSADTVTSNMINAGTYILDRETLESIPAEGFCMFEHDVFPRLVEAGEAVYGHPSHAYWIDIGTPEKYLKLHHDLLHRQAETARPDDVTCIEGDCDVHPSAQITGPVIVARNSVIGRDVVVKGPSVIGTGCHVGAASRIDGAIVWNNSRLGERVSAQRCVIAENVAVGDGSRILERSVIGDRVVLGRYQKVGPDERLDSGVR